MEGPVYPSVVRPATADREEMNRVIMDELVRSVLKPEGRGVFQRVYTRMKDEDAMRSSWAARRFRSS